MEPTSQQLAPTEPQPKSVSWIVREGTAEDLPFILDSWRKSFHYSPEVDGCPASVYYPKMLTVIQRLLSRPSTRVAVACPEGEDSFFIGGWVCYEENVELIDRDTKTLGSKIHFVFSREKGLGMWKLLVRAQRLDQKTAIYTSFTKALRRVTLPSSWRYDPFDKWER